jgi:hypothetical protein
MIGGDTGGPYAQSDMSTSLSSHLKEVEYEVLVTLMASTLKQRKSQEVDWKAQTDLRKDRSLHLLKASVTVELRALLSSDMIGPIDDDEHEQETASFLSFLKLSNVL